MREAVLSAVRAGWHPVAILRHWALTDRELLAILLGHPAPIGTNVHGWTYWAPQFDSINSAARIRT